MKIENIITQAKPIFPTQTVDFENLQNLLDQTCSQIAQRFKLYNPKGKPRKATIIDAIARSTCVVCIAKNLSGHTAANDVDALYIECHRLAVNVLVEELHNLFSKMGYKVMISTEAQLNYGKADVIITITKYGINLKCSANELVIEVKTGTSLSLSQLFRYLLDKRSNTIVVWRVRRRQVLAFDSQELNPLLMEFMKICIMRGMRLLESSEPLACEHLSQSSCWSPTQNELQKMFQDFSKALMETLPYILQTILEKLDIEGNCIKSQ